MQTNSSIQPESDAALTLRQPVNVNQVHEESLNIHDKIALAITSALGTMWAVYIMSTAMALWMLAQAWLKKEAFDPYPYAFLLFIGNVVQLLLMPLIMVGQNIQGRHAEMRAEESYKSTLANLNDVKRMMDQQAAIDRELILHREMLTKLLAAVDSNGENSQFANADGIYVSTSGRIEDD